jgi:hypothetical protein
MMIRILQLSLRRLYANTVAVKVKRHAKRVIPSSTVRRVG